MADKSTDLFMQFKVIRALSDATDSSSLEETSVDTGLSIRGQVAWIIHLVEFGWGSNMEGDLLLVAALSTRKGLVTRPKPADPGFIAGRTIHCSLATEGGTVRYEPTQQHFLPPIPLAAPKLSAYVQSGADDVSLRNGEMFIRIGFTTVSLDAKTYVELAEVWGW